jgi:phosphate transport system substrate-binding protein
MTVLLTLVSSGCARPDRYQGSLKRSGNAGKLITVKGSDTMVDLTSNWAEVFMEQHPKLSVSVTGGGSGTGFAALINQTTDIAASSRDIEPKEVQYAEKKGVKPVAHLVGKDGLAIVVNRDNPVNALTMAQLKDIFTGNVTNWSQVGGPDRKILVYSRESSSGTYVFFKEHVLKKKDFVETARLMPASTTIVEATASDLGGIGYVGLGYSEKAGGRIKILKVKADKAAPAVAPSEQTITDGSYPIARPLYLYTDQDPRPNARLFLAFTVSPKGQAIVRQTGYVPVNAGGRP